MEVLHSNPVTFLFLPTNERTTIVQPPNSEISSVLVWKRTHVCFSQELSRVLTFVPGWKTGMFLSDRCSVTLNQLRQNGAGQRSAG